MDKNKLEITAAEQEFLGTMTNLSNYTPVMKNEKYSFDKGLGDNASQELYVCDPCDGCGSDACSSCDGCIAD